MRSAEFKGGRTPAAIGGTSSPRRRAWPAWVRFAAGLTAAAALAGCSRDATAAGTRLAWKLPPGTELSVTIETSTTSESEGSAPPEVKPLDRPIQATIQGRFLLKSVREAGEGEVELELTPVSISIEGEIAGARLDLAYEEGEWVRETVEAPEGAPEGMADEMRKGLKAAMTAKAAGRARPYAMRPEAPATTMGASVFRAFPVLPSEPVRVGDEWTERGPLGSFLNSGGPFELKMTNRYKSEAEGIAVIETTLQHTFEQEGVVQAAERTRRTRFDVARGHVAAVADDVTTALTHGGFRMKLRVRSRVAVERLR